MGTRDWPDILRQALDRPGAPSSDFDLNRDIVLPEGRRLNEAAVLVVLQADQLILTKRSARLKHHPGQIAFPGGRRDPEDASLAECAMREAWEEIGLPPRQVELIGTMPPHETVTGYQVYPVLARVDGVFADRPEEGEVSEVFRVPVDHVTRRMNFRVEGRRWQGQRREYYAVPYGPYYIWGATARILRALADRIDA